MKPNGFMLLALCVAVAQSAIDRQKRDVPNGCGLPYFQQNLLPGARARIIGGSEAIPNSYPWIARLMYTMENGGTTRCGASLIMGSSSTESDLVITAAHCVLNSDRTMRPVDKFTVFLGKHDLSIKENSEQSVGIKKYIHNPDFLKGRNQGDLAILKLQKPIKFDSFIRPICLATSGQSPKDKNSCVVAGWGRIASDSHDLPDKLQQTKSPVHDDTTCSNLVGNIFDPATMTCSANLDGSSGTCQGDSGGPLACFEDGHWTLYGATSFNVAKKVNDLTVCIEANKPKVFARISGMRDWIDQTIKTM
jgi:secreted trypsin-like serine protease